MQTETFTLDQLKRDPSRLDDRAAAENGAIIVDGGLPRAIVLTTDKYPPQMALDLLECACGAAALRSMQNHLAAIGLNKMSLDEINDLIYGTQSA